jgi:hypothetical protein
MARVKGGHIEVGGLVIGLIFGPYEEIQEAAQAVLDGARAETDKTIVDGIVAANKYPDHVVVAVALALHYVDNRETPIDEALIFDAICFLDRIDTQNLKVTGK